MKFGVGLGLGVALAMGLSGIGQAQGRTIDPDQAGDLAAVPASEANYGTRPPAPSPADPVPEEEEEAPADDVVIQGAMPRPGAAGTVAGDAERTTYAQDDVLSAAEGVFGAGAKDLAKLVEKIFAEQGRPNAYIAGREAGAAVVVGLRYGSGTMFHKVEGELPVYWTGPSVGFDLGANGAKSFVLVYNLYDSHDIYRRYPAVEGAAYIVGGFTATYLRRGDVVLIPIRLGVGWRLGVNVGYMNITEKSRILPF